MNPFEFIAAVVKYLPTVISLVKTVEEAIPQAGAGVAKLEAVLGFLEAAEVALSSELATKLVNIAVALLNKTIWKK